MAMSGGTAKLVKTTKSNYGTGFEIKLYVYYKSTQDASTNKSTVSVGMYVVTPTNYGIGPWAKSSDSYVGTTSLTFDGSIPNFDGTRWLAENKTFTVSHKDDGTGSATINWKWGVNSPWGQMVNPSGSFDITLPTIARASVPTIKNSSDKVVTACGMGDTFTIYTNRKSSSFTHTLQYTFAGSTSTIASGVGASYKWKVPDLASKINNKLSGDCTITCTTYNGSTKIGTKTIDVDLWVPVASKPTLSVSSLDLGKSLTITTNRKSSNFTHKLTYSFADLSGQSIASGVTTSTSWTPPLSLASKIPSETSGTLTISCTTYNGTKSRGTETVTCKITVPNNDTFIPKISSVTLKPVGSLSSKFDGLYVFGKTKLQATYNASSSYSTIKQYSTNVGGKAYGGNPATSDLLTTGTETLVFCAVVDARGYVYGVDTMIRVIPYSSPYISNIVCERSDKDGNYKDDGTYLHIKCTRNFSSVDSLNGCTVKVTCGGKTEKLTNFNDKNTFDGVVPNITLDTMATYSVTLNITDDIGDYRDYILAIPTADCTFHLGVGGNSVGVGGYVDEDDEGYFKCYLKGRFIDGLYADRLYANHIEKLALYDGKNFDDLIYNTGYYSGPSKPSVLKCEGYPVDKTGVLEVISVMFDNDNQYGEDIELWGFAYQTYRTYDGDIFTRAYYTDAGFTNWVKLTTTAI